MERFLSKGYKFINYLVYHIIFLKAITMAWG